MKPGALTEYLGHIDPAQRMTPKELGASVRSPKLFAQRGMTKGGGDNEEQIMELAGDMVFGPEFGGRREAIVRDILKDSTDPGVLNLLRNRHWTPDQFTTAEGEANLMLQRNGNDYTSRINDVYMDELIEDALPMAWAEVNATTGKTMAPAYSSYQRQPGLDSMVVKTLLTGEQKVPNYFETVLRSTPGQGRRDNLPFSPGSQWSEEPGELSTMHFANPSQLGHVRGSITPGGNVYAEELQSDPIEMFGKHGEAVPAAMTDIYGKLGRMLIDRSAEAGAPSVSFPDAYRIASVRNQGQTSFFRDVYDKQLSKQLYDPLAKRGVPLRQESGWTTMELPEGVLEAIKRDGLLNYKRGGLVRATAR